MKYLLATLILIALFFGFKSCFKEKYDIVEITDCGSLPEKLRSQEKPTRYNIINECKFAATDLPVTLDKPHTIIDGNNIVISAPSPNSASPNGFIFEAEDIILANLTMDGFTQPVTVRSKSNSILYNIKLSNSNKLAIYLGDGQAATEPAPVEQNEGAPEGNPLIWKDKFRLISEAYATGEDCTSVAHTLEAGHTQTADHVNDSLLACDVNIASVANLPAIGILAEGGDLTVDDTLSIENTKKGIYFPAAGSATVVFNTDVTTISGYTEYGIGLDDFTRVKVSTDAKLIIDNADPDSRDICVRASLLRPKPTDTDPQIYIINNLVFEDGGIVAGGEPLGENTPPLKLAVRDNCLGECDPTVQYCEDTMPFDNIESD
ncbi:MAG: hypothetical protein ACWA44_12960 [Thiotrichales bacterium]